MSRSPITMPETQSHSRSAHQQRIAYWAIVPLVFLIVAELLAALLLTSAVANIATISIILYVAVLLAGIIPAFMHPAATTNLLGCLSVALASLFWHASSILNQFQAFSDFTTWQHWLVLINGTLLAPLTLHLAANFPQRGVLSARVLAGYDALVGASLLILYLLPEALRPGALAVLVLIIDAGFVLAGYQYVRIIQFAHPRSPHAAQQARLLLLSLLVAETPFLLLPISLMLNLPLPLAFVLGVQVFLPLGLAYAIIRPDLFGIDAVLRRVLDYATVSLGLLIVYIGLNTVLSQIGREIGATWVYALTILSVIPVAAAFPPLRRFTQRFTDRLFYPERIAFAQAIRMARTTLALVVQREAVTTLLEHDFPQHLGATWARLVLRPAFDQPAAASQPGVWSMLLIVNGQPLGGYWLGPRYSGLSYAADEQEQLRGIIQQAALALAYAGTVDTLVQLNYELEERVSLRTEHVLAQQRELATFDERQRLARDLHDSVKQTLFSLGLGLRSARARIHSDPDAAITLLQQQEQATIQAQVEMGELLAQLRTPMTEMSDLVAILEQHTFGLAQQHGLQVHLNLPPALVLPEPLTRELAQIAREALHNVLRHSAVHEAQLSITIDQGQLTMIIADQGCGLDIAAASVGHGLRGMRERSMALGGILTIQSMPDKGTTIWVQLNLNNLPG